MHCVNVGTAVQSVHPQWKLCAIAHSNMIQIHKEIIFEFYLGVKCLLLWDMHVLEGLMLQP